jgi:hypothetical protein
MRSSPQRARTEDKEGEGGGESDRMNRINKMKEGPIHILILSILFILSNPLFLFPFPPLRALCGELLIRSP